MSDRRSFLVTGGAGFIGSHITAALLAAGHRVVVLDDLSSGKWANLQSTADFRVEPSTSEGGKGSLRLCRGSVRDQGTLARVVQGVQGVLHQAAVPSVPRSFADPVNTLRANVEGTAAVLETCQEYGVQRVVVASSSSIYGNNSTLPQEESLPSDPLSPYAASKIACEHLSRIYSRVHGLEVVALRYFNVFGPRQDPASRYAAVVPTFVTRMLAGKRPTIFGDGDQSRDFTYVGNVVAANLLAVGLHEDGSIPEAGTSTNVKSAKGLVANIACGRPHTLLELVTTINKLLGTSIEPEFTDPRPGDVRHSHADIELARGRLGYEPLVDFEEGLRRTIEWYRSSQGAANFPPVHEAS